MRSCSIPADYSAPTGREIYVARCASCHGDDGKGNASAVGQSSRLPADLTLLSKSNGGAFPEERVRAIISGAVDIPAQHGSDPMPIWGDLREARRETARQTANEYLDALIDYLKSIQRS